MEVYDKFMDWNPRPCKNVRFSAIPTEMRAVTATHSLLPKKEKKV